ncbi:MAG: diguanylate cyclase [Massilia sp.]|nr:diguanylate cyclase [Massilia sp.]
MLNLATVAAHCRVVLVDLCGDTRGAVDADQLAALLGAACAPSPPPLLRAASLDQALRLLREGGIALCVVRTGAAGAVDAVATLAALPQPAPLLVIAVDDEAAGAYPFPDAECYRAGAADVLTASLAPLALTAKVARFVQLARRQLEQAGVERELRDARGRLHSTAAAAGLAMWSWDIRRDRVVSDDTMQFLFDIYPDVAPADPAGGSPLSAYLRAIHPEDAARAQADLDSALARGGAYESDIRVLARDGRYRHVIAHGEVLSGADGRPSVLRGAVRDVSRTRLAEQALDASEERYRTLFEAVDDGVCIIEMIWDADGVPSDYRFLEANQAFVRHTGLAGAVGRTVLEMVPGHDQSWMALYGNVARTGEPLRYESDSPGAIARWFDVYATRVGGAGSDRVAVLFTDISERKRAQLELERLAADLTESNRRKNDFIATLAHELRNPLAPLRSGLPLLRLGGDDAQVRQRVIATMERQLNHMVELVDDLLDIGRITHGQIALKSVTVDLAEVAAAAVEAARPAIEARRHRLRIDASDTGDTAPLLVQGDPTRLIQVLNNLLNNAAKYTPEGGEVLLALAREDGDAVITVSDNGVGITAPDLREVFELFNQVGRDRFPGEGGLGIGLSLVRTLVELHGGAVAVASAGAGQGSTFTVRLPLSAPVPMPAVQAPSPVPAPSPPQNHPVRVLVVDDNSDAADTLAELLEMLGHSTQVANNGLDALEAMQDFRPQVVLLDLGMPDMNGYQVAEAIRNDRRFDQPLLAALTGWGGQQDREQTRAAGFDLHLTKPVDLAVIEKVLAGV